jgi:rRNA-processing protein EBP2
MAKKGNKGKKGGNKGKNASPVAKKEEPRITMKDLEEMSSGSEGGMPPEEEWDKDSKALKEAILGGKFDSLLKGEDGMDEDDDESIEEVELNDNEAVSSKKDNKKHVDPESSGDEDVDHAEQAGEASEDDDDEEEEAQPASGDKDDSDDEKDDGEEMEVEEDEEEEEKNHGKRHSIEQKNNVNSKALHIVTEELVAEKQGWSWAERFSVVPETPLPFGTYAEDGTPILIHDDLKREVSFYDTALEAVQEARRKCEEVNVPFARPDDFFVEMVKTDGENMIVRSGSSQVQMLTNSFVLMCVSHSLLQ